MLRLATHSDVQDAASHPTTSQAHDDIEDGAPDNGDTTNHRRGSSSGITDESNGSEHHLTAAELPGELGSEHGDRQHAEDTICVDSSERSSEYMW